MLYEDVRNLEPFISRAKGLSQNKQIVLIVSTNQATATRLQNIYDDSSDIGSNLFYVSHVLCIFCIDLSLLMICLANLFSLYRIRFIL